MADLIDRAALLSEIAEDIRTSGCVNHERDILDSIRYAPRVAAEPVVHARWKHKDNSRNTTRIGDFEEWYECSACFGSAEWMSERCPHCGAHMDADRVDANGDAPERGGKDG